MNPNQKQQGDVICKKVNSIPKQFKPIKRKNGKFVLAEGEATGHSHVIDAEEFVSSVDDEKFLINPTGPIIHEEHKSITLEPGIWEVGEVVEKDWLSGMVNPVRD